MFSGKPGSADATERGLARNYSVGAGLGSRQPAGGGTSFGGLWRLGTRLRPGSRNDNAGGVGGGGGSSRSPGSGAAFSLSSLGKSFTRPSFVRRRAAARTAFGAGRGDVAEPPAGDDARGGGDKGAGSDGEVSGSDDEEAEDAEEAEEQRKTAGGALVAVEHSAKGV